MPDGLETTLGALVDSGGGLIHTGPFGSQLHAGDYVEDGIPIVMPQQLGDNEIRMDGISRVAEHDRDRLARHVMHKGDIRSLRTLFIENRRLRAARDLLLPRLMNGEIAI